MYKGVRVVILNSDGEILILKRNSVDLDYPNFWDVPGGGVNDGESIKDAMEREAEEECSLKIKIEESNFNDFYHPEKGIHIYGFKADLIGGEVLLSEEHTEYKWISKDEWQKFEYIPSVTETLKVYFKS